MIRLNCVVEGQTEQGFINRVIRPYLSNKHIYCSTRCVQTSRKKGRKFSGGMSRYAQFKGDLQRWMREESKIDAYFTTMIDLYALPNDFPDYEQAFRYSDPFESVETLEQAFRVDMEHHRFIPYIQIHEFEALLFCDISQFEHLFLDRKQALQVLSSVSLQFSSPEHIDRGPDTAPSKRIIEQIPEYASQKALSGPLIAEAIGLDVLRTHCSHFNQWIAALETLPEK